MDTRSVGKRITYKRCRPNPVFEDWLKELYDEAKGKKSKLEPMIQEALESLVKYPLPLQNGQDCAILKGFDKKLCLFLDKRLDWVKSNSIAINTAPISVSPENFACLETCKLQSKTLKNDPSMPSTSYSSNESDNCLKSQTNTSSDANSQNHNIDILSQNASNNQVKGKPNQLDNSLVKRKPKKNKYTPKHGSGGFAILLTLLEHSRCNPQNPSLTKVEIIEKGQKYSNESFTQVKPESFYTAWSNMSRLLQKGLVMKTRTKKLIKFSLTDEGMSFAAELSHTASNTLTANDIIFDKISVTPVTANKENECMQKILNIDVKSCSESILEMIAGSFDIVLVIDKNETGGVSKKNDPTVAQFNKYPDLKHEYRSLKVGDFTWIARSKTNHDRELVLPYIIERKRMDDLGASIKDGRFHEQKFRLRKCGLLNVIYMVENYGSNKHVGLPLQSLKQALANTQVQDHFKIHVTESLSNSARFLAMMTKRLTIEYKDKNLIGSHREPQPNQLMTFEYFNKSSSKTRPLTVTETFIKMLLQLKGVSVEKALAVTNQYQTPKMLIKAYEDCDKKDGEMLLANLRHGSLNRNVGPSVSKSIYQLLSHCIK